MNIEAIESARNLLGLVRSTTDAIGVAVSYGKDSLATLDLCARMFSRIEGYYLFRVRGLAIVEEWAEAVRKRYGVLIRDYPHFDLSRCYRNAVLQPHWVGLQCPPKVMMVDIEGSFRADANVEWIAYGWRRNDSLSRALIMKKCRGYDPDARRVFPLRAWRRVDVLAYLDCRGIPRPPELGRTEQGGLDFHAGALRVLRDQYPLDWSRWLRDFPFSGAQLEQPQPSAHRAKRQTPRGGEHPSDGTLKPR